MKKKKIPCRVCGKLFQPCATCQSKTDMFTWRSFACSRKCAIKYINQATQYRKTQKNKFVQSKPLTIEQSHIKEEIEIPKNMKNEPSINNELKKYKRKNEKTVMENTQSTPIMVGTNDE